MAERLAAFERLRTQGGAIEELHVENNEEVNEYSLGTGFYIQCITIRIASVYSCCLLDILIL